MISIYLPKKKKNIETRKQIIRIYSQDIRVTFCTGKCAILIIKNGEKRNNGKRIELWNLENIKRVWRKENYEYQGRLEVGTSKGAERKRKKKRNISKEKENSLKPNSAAEISSKK